MLAVHQAGFRATTGAIGRPRHVVGCRFNHAQVHAGLIMQLMHVHWMLSMSVALLQYGNRHCPLPADEFAVSQQGGAGRRGRQRQVGAGKKRVADADVSAAGSILQIS